MPNKKNTISMRDERVASWVESVAECFLQIDNPRLSIPTQFQASLNRHLKDLSRQHLLAFMARPTVHRDREAYRREAEHIYEMVDECHQLWADSVLRSSPLLLASLEAMVAATIALMPLSPQAAGIAECDVMAQLYVLDRQLACDNIVGAAHDWYEVRRPYQTQEAWLSPSYVIVMRRLARAGRLQATPREEGGFSYKTEPDLLNWATRELEAIHGPGWVEEFTLSCLQAIKASADCTPREYELDLIAFQ